MPTSPGTSLCTPSASSSPSSPSYVQLNVVGMTSSFTSPLQPYLICTWAHVNFNFGQAVYRYMHGPYLDPTHTSCSSAVT
eukprot:1078507-Prymnesium_polylepis.2